GGSFWHHSGRLRMRVGGLDSSGFTGSRTRGLQCVSGAGVTTRLDGRTGREVRVYPSGTWEGFWYQEAFGRQPMTAFTLNFVGGRITGEGRDVVGRFTYAGEYEEATGDV